jgi:acyl carrier protein
MSAAHDRDEMTRRILAAVAKSRRPGLGEVSAATPLIGDDGLDSMKLVELCLSLEDLATDHGFDFDWTSENAMSRSRSMFRNVGALTQEFMAQMEAKT